MSTVKLDKYVMCRQDREGRQRVQKRGRGLLTIIISKYAADSEKMAELTDVIRIWKRNGRSFRDKTGKM